MNSLDCLLNEFFPTKDLPQQHEHSEDDAIQRLFADRDEACQQLSAVQAHLDDVMDRSMNGMVTLSSLVDSALLARHGLIEPSSFLHDTAFTLIDDGGSAGPQPAPLAPALLMQRTPTKKPPLPLLHQTLPATRSASNNNTNDDDDETHECTLRLARLRQQGRFLENPRFASHSASFTANPKTLLFDSYSAGDSLESTLTLTNTSRVRRHFRIVPMQTSKQSSFSIHGGTPLDGTLAPGLSTRIGIQFHAHNLAPVNDQLIVESEGGHALVVPIVAHLNVPQLDLPDSVDCGPCLAGESVSTSLVVTNSAGGVGCCRLALENNSGDVFALSVPLLHFTHAKQSLSLSVTFTPDKCATRFTSTLICFFDDGHSTRHSLVGTQVEAHVTVPLPDTLESADYVYPHSFLLLRDNNTKLHCVDFGDALVLPSATHTYQFCVKSHSPVPLPVLWHTPNKNGLDNDPPPFHVSPSHTTIPPLATVLFTVHFSPFSTTPYSFFTNLCLTVPSNDSDGGSPDSLGSSQSLPPTIAIAHFRFDGSGAPFQLSISPPALFFDTPLLITQTHASPVPLRITNKSAATALKCAITVDECFPSSTQVDIHPSIVTTPPAHVVSVYVRLTPLTPGPIRVILRCTVVNSRVPWEDTGAVQRILVRAFATGPTVRLLQPDLSFTPLCNLSLSASASLSLVNDSPILANWSLSDLDRSEHSYISFSPSSGQLLPGEHLNSVLATLHFSDTSSVDRSETLHQCQLDVTHGESTPFIARATRVRPSVLIDSPLVDLPLLLYESSSTNATFTMLNATELPTPFKWLALLAEDSPPHVSVSVSPSDGSLAPHSRQSVTVHVQSVTHVDSPTPFRLPLACFLNSITNTTSTGVILTGTVSPLQIHYSVEGESLVSTNATLSLTCNTTVTTHHTSSLATFVSRTLLIHNPTPLAHPYTLSMHMSSPPTPSCSFYFIGDNANHFLTSSGTLQANSITRVPFGVTVDFYGDYTAHIDAHVSSFDPQTVLRISLTATGCPLSLSNAPNTLGLELTHTSSSSLPLLSLGSTVPSSAVQRTFHLHNNSSLPLSVQWFFHDSLATDHESFSKFVSTALGAAESGIVQVNTRQHEEIPLAYETSSAFHLTSQSPLTIGPHSTSNVSVQFTSPHSLPTPQQQQQQQQGRDFYATLIGHSSVLNSTQTRKPDMAELFRLACRATVVTPILLCDDSDEGCELHLNGSGESEHAHITFVNGSAASLTLSFRLTGSRHFTLVASNQSHSPLVLRPREHTTVHVCYALAEPSLSSEPLNSSTARLDALCGDDPAHAQVCQSVSLRGVVHLSAQSS